MNWLLSHVPHILGGLGIGGAGGAIIFRDAIGKGWDAWMADRKSAREERLSAQGGGDRLAASVVKILTDDLAAQRVNDGTLRSILDRLVTAVENLSERQEEFNRKQDATDARIDRWERARGIN